MPSPAASVATRTRQSGSWVKRSWIARRSSRPMPPWIATTALGVAEEGAEPVDEVVQRVAVLGEDDQLASAAVGVEHLAAVRTAAPTSSLHLRSVPDVADLARPAPRAASRVAISASSSATVARGGRRVDDLVLELLALVGVEVVPDVVVESSSSPSNAEQPLLLGVDAERCGAGPLRSSTTRASSRLRRRAQRLVDRLRRRRQPALQHGEREADACCRGGPRPRAFSRSARFISLADVVGDLVVELALRGRTAGTATVYARRSGNSGLPSKREQLLLDHAAHQVATDRPCGRRRGSCPRSGRRRAGPGRAGSPPPCRRAASPSSAGGGGRSPPSSSPSW